MRHLVKTAQEMGRSEHFISIFRLQSNFSLCCVVASLGVKIFVYDDRMIPEIHEKEFLTDELGGCDCVA
jgi:hypothetical protein